MPITSQVLKLARRPQQVIEIQRKITECLFQKPNNVIHIAEISKYWHEDDIENCFQVIEHLVLEARITRLRKLLAGSLI